jgi:hypothetical protein
MTTTTDNTDRAAAPSEDRLAANYTQLTLATLVAGVMLLAVAAACFMLYLGKGWNSRPYAFWALALGLTFLVIGALAIAYRGSDRSSDAERSRTLVLALLGCFGLATAILGLTLPLAYSEIFGGALKVWRENMNKVVLCGSILFGGMLVMFAGLVLSRSYGLQLPNLRRLVYGYNAIIGACLLLCILGLINLLPYMQLVPFKYLSKTYDWTTSGLYSLQPQSQSILADLKQPVKVYVLLNPSDPVTPEVETLLNNCRNETSQVTWQMYSRDFNRSEVEDLSKKYQLPDSVGLLVTYGTEPNVTHEFIRRSDLVDDRSTPQGQRFTFKGEFALINAVRDLAQGQHKTTVYFTQGHGEPALEANFRRPDDDSLSTLRGELEKRGFQPKPLQLGVDTKSIPEDADVVAVVAPTRPYPAAILKVLRDYLSGAGGGKKGRLMVLLGPASSDKSRTAGLESLLLEFDVKVGNNRILAAGPTNPLLVEAIPNPESTNPLAKAFVRGQRVTLFTFQDVRTVDPLSAGPAGAGRYTVDPILLAIPDNLIWAEPDLEANPRALQAEVRGSRERLLQKISRTPLTVAVAVSEGKNPPPMMPGHPPIGGEAQPRLVVFGTATWVGNQAMTGRAGSNYLDLFTSGVSWLRERADLGKAAEGKDRAPYQLEVASGGGWRLVLLPLGLLLLTVVMLGCGIWVVRRR